MIFGIHYMVLIVYLLIQRRKYTYEPWSKWQDQPIPVEIYENWKNNGSFDNGIAIICGKIWRGSVQGQISSLHRH